MAVTPHAKSLARPQAARRGRLCVQPVEGETRKFAERFDFPLTDRLETIGGSPVDAVLILTPPNTHLELVERCAAAGKHILLEKPLGDHPGAQRAI